MAGEVTTPNIGLQIPAYNQANWQVPINYDLNLLDLIFGPGGPQVPALNVAALTVANAGAALAPSFVEETPSGAVPGTTYTLSYAPSLLLGFYVNGVLQRAGIDFTRTLAVVTLASPTSGGQTVWAQYFK